MITHGMEGQFVAKAKNFDSFSMVDGGKDGVKSRDWYAWNNLMPPKPDDFHVVGQVYVSNPGVIGELRFKEPQGINPDNALLDLILIQRPGIWPQWFVWIEVRYDKIMLNAHYTHATIFHEGNAIRELLVHDVH